MVRRDDVLAGLAPPIFFVGSIPGLAGLELISPIPTKKSSIKASAQTYIF